jgi:succinyl-diaminopimelate desuccinylase
VTVTEIIGGTGYTAVPDLCTLKVDVRLTPAFDDQAAPALLDTIIAKADADWPGTRPTRVEVTTRWPAYRLPDDSALKTRS